MVRVCRVAALLTAVLLAAASCTMKKTDQPPLSGPSELALSLSLFAVPDVIAQDGLAQSQVVIQARDQSGQPIKNLPLRVDASVSNSQTAVGKLSAQSVNTDSDGRATVSFTAPPAPAGNADFGTVVTIRVTPVGTDYRNAVPRSVDIRLVPSGASGSGPVASFSFSPSSPIPNGTVTFDASASRSDVTISTYYWNFGDNTSGTGVAPQHVYRAEGEYVVTLRVIDASGRSSNPLSQTVIVGEAAEPTADFVFSPSDATTLVNVYFNAATSKAGAGRALVDYAWNFGVPGPVTKGITASKLFLVAGTYTVTLTVTDDVGQKATVSKTVTVK